MRAALHAAPRAALAALCCAFIPAPASSQSFDAMPSYEPEQQVEGTIRIRGDNGQGAMLKPFQKPHPPIVVTAILPASEGIAAAAARGWTPISANFVHPWVVATHWPKYVEGCARAGRQAKGEDWRVAKSIFVGDDDATVRRMTRGSGNLFAHYFRNLQRKSQAARGNALFKHEPSVPDEALTELRAAGS